MSSFSTPPAIAPSNAAKDGLFDIGLHENLHYQFEMVCGIASAFFYALRLCSVWSAKKLQANLNNRYSCAEETVFCVRSSLPTCHARCRRPTLFQDIDPVRGSEHGGYDPMHFAH